MRVSKEAAAATRNRIIGTASRLLRERGIEATSIADVMAAAGLTHGGFYKHFQSKDDLVAAAIEAAFAAQLARYDQRCDEQGPRAALEAYVADYLSPEHVAGAATGCPVAALGADAGRAPAAASTAMARGVESMIERYVNSLGSAADSAMERAAAIRRLAMMVGAVVVARGVGPGKLADEVIGACAVTEDLPPRTSRAPARSHRPGSTR
ncbi:MAG: TetR family transcriptional regulator [Hyphomicrobiales bacterium]